MCLVCQFEGKVVLESELDSKSDYCIPNWLGHPPCCACFLNSPEPSWCPTCSPWSTLWFLMTIKSLGSNLFSRSLADEHKNVYWWRSYCAHDLVIGPCNSIEGMVVSNVVMSSSTGYGPVDQLAVVLWIGSGTLFLWSSGSVHRCWRLCKRLL
jgi:hypothetical protein